MKKGVSYLFIFSMMTTLTSCGFYRNIDVASFETRKVSVYELYDIDENKTYTLSEVKGKQDIEIKYLPNMEYIPYISLTDYLSLLPYQDSFSYTSVKTYNGETFYIGKIDEQTGKVGSYYYQGIINTSKKTYSYQGGIYATLKIYEEKPDITKGLDYKYRYIRAGNKLNVYNFSNYFINIYMENDTIYYPLSFLDTSISGESTIYTHFDYDKLFTFTSYKDAINFKYLLGQEECSISTTIEKHARNINQNNMPGYLRIFNRDMFLYMMDNYYGLASVRNISSMSEYYKEQGLYTDFTDEDATIRGYAYSHALNKLNDDHTGIVANFGNKVWGEDVDTTRGNESINRRTIYKQLEESRKNIYEASGLTIEDVRYSNDGKTAVIVFDGFMDGCITELADKFELVKNKGGVENVILDISTNGGGYLGYYFKALALISSDANFTAYEFDEASNTVIELYGTYDRNDDSDITVDDCYGDDFNISILTSCGSFSCGNAFPCSAKELKTAKILGKTSGGGECTVEVHYLANMFFAQHSSMTHLGTYKNNTFVGYEDGATPDIELEYADFYDIEKLNQLISK